MDVLGADIDFAGSSMADLLEARDQYHWHLLNKKNVVGTAIGRYLIRTTDPQPDQAKRVFSARRAMTVKPARTFENSEVRDYSWPCILVLVDEWLDADQFGLGDGQTSPDQVVPKTLYLPDGRTVPVCVVLVLRSAPDESVLPPRTWPAGRIGGGFPLLCEVQGVQNFASVGTLVTDGHTVFALTSRHVTGPAGTVVSSIADGTETPIGRSGANQLTRLPFSDVYTDFPGRRTYLTLDAGLIEVDDVTAWTSQGYGLPVVGELADLNEQNISVRLIGAEVRAFGAASGNLSGRITALFYRYRSVGGYDDVTDFLISPTPGTPDSRPGDSGTLWHLVQADGQPLRPIALQWGGQSFLAATGKNYNFTLATSLTNILRLLNVELVVDYNTGAQPFWGKTGHYTIASYATEHLTSPTLQTLMTNNVDRISFALRDLDATGINKSTIAGKNAGGFVPLADVPDLVWKNLPSAVKGGRDTAFRTGPEHPTHFADADQPRPSDQKTIRELCMADPTNVNVAVWQEYYTSLGHTDPDDRGLLPFRVWQFFDEMVAAIKAKNLTRYVAAAGLVAHYVGDACQPLHGSYLADGLPDGTGSGVHSAYESTMVDRHDTDILTALTTALKNATPHPTVTTGQQVAVEIVHLMDRSANAIDPKTLVLAYAAVAKKKGDSSVKVTDALWAQFGQQTVGLFADGALTLAMVWQSAWDTAKGDTKIPDTTDVGAIATAALQVLYEDPGFVPSLDLDHIGTVLQPSPRKKS